MIDHVGFAVLDYERAKAFYAKALAPLGYMLIMEVGKDQTASGHPAAGFGAGGKPDFWIGGEGKLDSRCTWRSPPGIAPASMRSIVPGLPREARTMARRACARSTIRTIMGRSCAIPTVITSRPSATLRASVPIPKFASL